MKKYTGTKTVKATPAVRKAGKVYLPEDVIPEGPEPQENGYKVIYPDGYEGWSSKDDFELSYRSFESYRNMLRVNTLSFSSRLNKLDKLIGSDTGVFLSSDEKDLIYDIKNAALDCLDILNSSICTRMDGEYYASNYMTFGQAIEALKRGEAIAREGWNGKGLFVIKQVPARIDREIIPKMQSLPYQAKELILAKKGIINYNNQCLIYNSNTGNADSWVPSISDVFAEDWMIVE